MPLWATSSEARCTKMYKSHKEIQELLLFASLCHYAAIAQKQGKKKIEKRLNSSLVSIDILPSSTLRLVYWYRCKACVLQLRSLDLCGKKCARTERTERTKPCHQLFDQVPIRPIRCQKKCIWCLWAQLENSILSAERAKNGKDKAQFWSCPFLFHECSIVMFVPLATRSYQVYQPERDSSTLQPSNK